MSDLVHIPFRDTEVLAVGVDGKPHVVLKPFVESLGLAYQPQHRKLSGKSWASVTTTVIQVPGSPQRREYTVVDVRTALMLLATIDERRVSDEARPLLIAYQSEVADAIEAYWTSGGAINPRATEEQLDGIITRSERQMRVLQGMRGIVDPRWLESKARHVAANALDEEPDITPATRMLTVSDYLAGHGVTGKALRALASTFGKSVKKEYRRQHGRFPGTALRLVDGTEREVAAYTEADRPIFDAVWHRIYGEEVS